jgi:hypothetical protein
VHAGGARVIDRVLRHLRGRCKDVVEILEKDASYKQYSEEVHADGVRVIDCVLSHLWCGEVGVTKC